METKKIKAMYNCTGGGYSPYSDGILHKDGKIIATNGYLICVLKSDYDTEKEGKVINKKGEICDVRFPRWEEVIPKDYRDYPIDVDPKKLFEAAKNINGAIGIRTRQKIDTFIEINGHLVSSKLLFDALFVDSDVNLYLCRENRLIGENENFFFMVGTSEIEPEEKEKENNDSVSYQYVKKIYTIDEALEYKPFENVTFFDGSEIRAGKKIKEITLVENKFDVVFSDDKIHAVLNNVSQAYVNGDSIDHLIEQIGLNSLKEIDFVIPEKLNKSFFVITTNDESFQIDKQSGTLVNMVKFDGEYLEIIEKNGVYYWCLDGYSFCNQYHLNYDDVINRLKRNKYTAENIRAFIKKYTKK